jgi:hypothetical protein
MEGHVLNKSAVWLHAMKRAIAPGGKIPLSELYDQYGKKHELAKGKEFISWLKTVKLRDEDKWQVVSGKDKALTEVEDITLKEVKIDITKIKPKDMSIEDVISLSVRKARELLPKVTDVKLLKYSLSEARPKPGKDSLCRMLKKRIMELETQRR